MLDRESMANPETLERELALIRERIEHLTRERRVFGRLGFSSEQMRLELRQLEKRRTRYEQALKDWHQDGRKLALRRSPQVEG